ncbi:diguanylate cyclase/phosphodiesterase [Novosphingobium kunmingense]|uniref:Diguanylate cyclase/phosphodiesterase n=1 Tax=Novosphingobium kunmingense TaxID=1211806 RepID=A0A2N0I356_9SPHN|nr:EAL domain-containing protein [Novosphingobium kunmingense]PKB25624.1 diguanylate cyclase/phosphodiesterase [Novosphingobium kunmingense]
MSKEQPGAADSVSVDSAIARTARRDVVTLGTVVAAMVLLISTGSSVVDNAIASLEGHGTQPDNLLATTFLLNIALIVFGWRRYKDLVGEVKERRNAEEQARILAETDPLTGCLNRRSAGPVTDRLIAEASARGEVVAFLMLDLDNFKQVNDLHGHAAGDALLKEASRRIARRLPNGGQLARIGGDEFACIVPFTASQQETVERLAEDLIKVVAEPVSFGDLTLETTISVGVTRSDSDGDRHSAQDLLHMADIAMYQAKKNGRNRHFWFEASMESELRFRSELETGIRRGVATGEFVPYYEKQIDLATGDLVGFEMLARWNSPTLGVISPDLFIPIAEEIGVIAQLSESLIAKALIDAKTWDPQLTLSVNISPVQLRDPWFAQKLLKLLVEANFPPSRFEIEITESSLHENIGLVRSMITSLKNQGIRVSLDDFGTGYSSLSQLRSLPFDRIKIDRSFVTTLPGNKESATIVKSIAALGKGLGLPITVEGVENEEVLRELNRFGTFKVQGYLYGHPEPADRTAEELAQLNLLLDVSAACASKDEGDEDNAIRAAG